MRYLVKVDNVRAISEIENSWSDVDYIELLKRFDFDDAEKLSKDELKDMLFMAITDFDPDEAATVLLEYKLSHRLNRGQINQLSHEMISDRVSEEHADISLHFDLFKINQLLYSAYNGKFPKVKATEIEFHLISKSKMEHVISKEDALKALNGSLASGNLLQRLFEKQLSGKMKFVEADNILWTLELLEENHYKTITSEYWISEEDFTIQEFEVNIVDFEEEEKEEK